MMLAAIVAGAGIAISGLSVAAIAHRQPQEMAQATPPLQSTPGAESKPSEPASTTGTGARPHDTPPQPARPDADAQSSGAKPALPPAPAEKTAEPIQTK